MPGARAALNIDGMNQTQGLAGHHRFQRVPHRGYMLTLAGVFSVIWVLLALNPVDRHAWMLENVLTICGIIVLYLLRRKMPFSRLSLSLIFTFLRLHSIGAHYTYSLVPYDEWCRE